ncbi:DUF6303 family protein [Embleya sp. MST-111070]|uniref:DUF6303 family protein n=1 Tax=Embleya sp. MST-111070 TaxID=3398231 RepID=UPI003F73FD4C
MTFKALLSCRNGRWRVVVPVSGLVRDWPRHYFAHGSAVPTMAERSRALNALGFVFTDGAAWDWMEDADVPGDDTSPVRLTAAIDVRSAGGEGS